MALGIQATGLWFVNFVALGGIITVLHIMLVLTATCQRATFKNYLTSLFISIRSKAQGSINIYTTLQLSTLIALVQMTWGFKCPLKFFCVNRRQQLTVGNQTALFRKQYLMRLQRLVSAYWTLPLEELCSCLPFISWQSYRGLFATHVWQRTPWLRRRVALVKFIHTGSVRAQIKATFFAFVDA